MAAKAKISVTLDRNTVAALDLAVKQRRFLSRSGALEQAVSSWLREEQRRMRDTEIDRYYDAMTDAERQEDREWADLGARLLVRETTPGDSHCARL